MSKHEAYIHARANLPQTAEKREVEGRHPEAGDRVTWINRGQRWFGKIREYQPDHDRWLVVAEDHSFADEMTERPKVMMRGQDDCIIAALAYVWGVEYEEVGEGDWLEDFLVAHGFVMCAPVDVTQPLWVGVRNSVAFDGDRVIGLDDGQGPGHAVVMSYDRMLYDPDSTTENPWETTPQQCRYGLRPDLPIEPDFHLFSLSTLPSKALPQARTRSPS